MSKISGYANSVSALGTDDLIDVSEKISSSPDVYESRKMTGAILAAFIQSYTNDSIYSASGTVPSSVVATITDFLRFSGGRLDLSTTTDGFLMPRLTTAQMNAIASPTTNLLIYNTSLSGLYRYDGSAWVALSAGYGVVAINDGSGSPTYYATISAAMTAASSGDTVVLHSNITETGNVTITIPDGVNFNLNGYTYTLDGSDNDAVEYVNNGTNIKIVNGYIIKKNSPTPNGGGIGLDINGASPFVDCTGLTVVSDGTYCLNFNSSPDTSGTLQNGSFIYESVSGNPTYAHFVDGIISGCYFDSQGTSTRVSNSILSNCSFKGVFSLVGSTRASNCFVNGEATLNGTSILTNSQIYSTSGIALTLSDAGNIVKGCYAYSTGGAGVYIQNGKVYDTTGNSTNSYGIWVNGTSAYLYSSVAISSAAAAVRLRNGSKIYKSQAFCNWNNAGGHAISVENAGGFEIIDCYCEVVNTSAFAVTGAFFGFIEGVKGKGMTALIGTTTNSLTSTPDAYGNTLLA